MNVVVLGIRGFPNIQGGIETHCQHLYPRLVDLGCNVTVFARSEYVGSDEYTYKSVKVVPVKTIRQKSLEAFLHTYKCRLLSGKYSPNIIHFHAIGPSLFVPISRIKGAKVVSTHHGFDYDRKKWGMIAKGVLKYGEKQMCKADAVISISQHISDYLRKKYNCNLFQIPNGVTLPEILKPSEYCKKWKIKKGKYILFTGRLVPEKGVHELIEAYSQLQTDWKLVIAGDADHEDSYSRKVKILGKKYSNIIMTGFISGRELQEIYSNASLFVLPSSHEGLPIAMLEALSYGLPCIASDIPANKSVGHDSIDYFRLHDINQLTTVIKNSIKSKKKIDQNEIRQFVNINYNWDKIAHMTLNVYKQISKKDKK